MLRRAPGWVLQQQRHLQSVLLRWRQSAEYPLQDPAQQITKPREGQRRLRLGWTAGQDQVRTRGRVGQPSQPHRGLADPGFAFHHQPGRPGRQPIQKRRHRTELAPAPQHTARAVRTGSVRPPSHSPSPRRESSQDQLILK